MATITLQQALDRLNQADYTKVWDATGACFVVRERWEDPDTGEVVERAHNYLEDNAPPAEPAAEEQTIEAADDATTPVTGTVAAADTGKLA